MSSEPWKEFDCYKVLEIPPSANPEDIRVARRRVSQKTHPDVGGTKEAQTRVNLAYEILSDPISRQSHDFYWYGTPSKSEEARRGSGWTSSRSASRPVRRQAKEDSQK